jgi:hypothetical protein
MAGSRPARRLRWRFGGVELLGQGGRATRTLAELVDEDAGGAPAAARVARRAAHGEGSRITGRAATGRAQVERATVPSAARRSSTAGCAASGDTRPMVGVG